MIQQDLADNHPLESRRKIAATAAKAWAKEATSAEIREANVTPKLDELDTAIAAEFKSEEDSSCFEIGT